MFSPVVREYYCDQVWQVPEGASLYLLDQVPSQDHSLGKIRLKTNSNCSLVFWGKYFNQVQIHIIIIKIKGFFSLEWFFWEIQNLSIYKFGVFVCMYVCPHFSPKLWEMDPTNHIYSERAWPKDGFCDIKNMGHSVTKTVCTWGAQWPTLNHYIASFCIWIK